MPQSSGRPFLFPMPSPLKTDQFHLLPRQRLRTQGPELSSSGRSSRTGLLVSSPVPSRLPASPDRHWLPPPCMGTELCWKVAWVLVTPHTSCPTPTGSAYLPSSFFLLAVWFCHHKNSSARTSHMGLVVVVTLVSCQLSPG